MADLRVEGITKAYPGLPVLDGVSFGVAAGEFVSVIGPSGCGKSTLFDVVAGYTISIVAAEHDLGLGRAGTD